MIQTTRQGELTTLEAAEAKPVEIQRLEYGKFCISPDGPIEELAEHRQLGYSPDFPKDLVEFCDPSRISLAPELGDELPLDTREHGTLLRPVFLGGKPWPVMYRSRLRPEDAEYGSGRLYTMARYVTSLSTEVSPSALLAAMNSTALRGITHQQLETPLAPIVILRGELPQFDEDCREFLKDGLVYVLSGIPISIAGRIDEQIFFDCVTALWCSLPAALRPFVSAGWGVGGSLSGRLFVTCATRCSENSAIFSLERAPGERWSPPSKVDVVRDGRIERRDFSATRMIPGEMYVRHVYGDLTGSLADLAATSASQQAMELGRSLPSYDNPALPDLLDPRIVRVIRYGGFEADDKHRLKLLDRWYATGDEPDDPRFCTDAKRLTHKRNRLTAILRAVEAQGDPASRKYADQVVWESFKSDGKPSSKEIISQAIQNIDRMDGPGAARAQLFIAVSLGEPDPVMAALINARNAKAAERLPEPLQDAMFKILQSSLLEPGTVMAHIAWLSAEDINSLTQVYCKWVRQHTFDLAVAILSAEGENATACQRVYDLAPSPVTRTLWRCAGNELPDNGDAEVINTLATGQRDVFSRMLVTRWEHQAGETARRRDVLLSWLDLAPPRTARDPLLLFAFGRMPDPEHLPAIARDIGRNVVPESMLSRLAAPMLEHWYYVGSQISGGGAWARVFSMWPAGVARALGVSNMPGPETVSEEMSTAAAKAVIRPDHLQDCITAYRRARDNSPVVARWLWTWASRAGRSISSSPLAVDICRSLSSGNNLPELEPETEEMTKALYLAEMSGERERLLQSAGALWNAASNAWHLRFYLEMFRESDFSPSGMQLGALVYYQDWLKEHLRKRNIHHLRASRFRVATFPFHRARYPGSDGVLWREDYTRTRISAAFSGVPVEMQGRLRDALSVYGSSREQRAALCVTYLRAHQNRADRDRAIERVMSDHLLPDAAGSLDASETKRLFKEIDADIWGTTGDRAGLLRRSFRLITWPLRALVRLLQGIWHLVSGREDRQIQVPTYLRPLLEELVLDRRMKVISKAINRYHKRQR